VVFKELLKAGAQVRDHLCLAFHCAVKVKTYAAYLNTKLIPLAYLAEKFGHGIEIFGGYASVVQAGAAQEFSFNKSHPASKLSGTYGGAVATGPAAYYADIVSQEDFS